MNTQNKALYSISVFFTGCDTGQVAGSSDNNDKTYWETFQTVAYTGESTEYRSFEEIRYFPPFWISMCVCAAKSHLADQWAELCCCIRPNELLMHIQFVH